MTFANNAIRLLRRPVAPILIIITENPAAGLMDGGIVGH
jgi:hypothetical protein